MEVEECLVQHIARVKEILDAIKKMNSGKSTGMDEFEVEMLNGIGCDGGVDDKVANGMNERGEST